MTKRPTVLFLCIHNAGRSQMAAGLMEHLAGDRIEVRSAGSAPAESLNPMAVEAMREIGIDIAGRQPRILDPEDMRTIDVVVTMGCGDECPFFPDVRYEDWQLDDPAGQDLETVRRIRDEIRAHVEQLAEEFVPAVKPQ
ncbi:arsenate reductase ArsC [Pseudoclavibacter alba]|uniref:Arsenate reductase ArsC n=1 Tax=Pseudoclavibacter albus TaxID=272241 RepID=A0ABT2HY13_9MICO|nr:arsenate reductase ArsC [Pseudoclavibacter alba]MCT2043194.1 arsenate reductase ArsC [Pseudoclavibacter alba]